MSLKNLKFARISLLLSLLVGEVPCVNAAQDESGTYVLFQQTTTITHLPVVKDIVTKTYSTVVMRLTHEEGRLKGAGSLCDLSMESNSRMVVTTFPPAFVQALPHVSLDASLTEVGSEVKFHQPPQTLVLGAHLKDPMKDPLPQNSADSRVYDQDHDGQPGMTVQVSGLVSGEVYVVQRSTTTLSGKKSGVAYIGSITFDVEQKVVGASSAVLKNGRDPKPDPSRSFFRLQKLEANASCADAEKLSQTWR